MQRDFGTAGRIGLLTPQANTTVEPEFYRALGPDIAIYTARLASRIVDPRARLIAYLEELKDTIDQYGGMELDAIGFACTGSCYLVDAARAEALVSAAQTQARAPILVPTDAIDARLQAINARRIALISPYPDWLTRDCAAYWARRGYEIAAIARVGAVGAQLTAIYALTALDALRASDDLLGIACDAVLITGTGLASLSVLAPIAERLGRPALSSNSCLAEALLQQVTAGTRAGI